MCVGPTLPSLFLLRENNNSYNDDELLIERESHSESDSDSDVLDDREEVTVPLRTSTSLGSFEFDPGYIFWRSLHPPETHHTPEEMAIASSRRFLKPPVQVPVKSIALATFLCAAGTILFILGLLICTGHIDSKFSDRVWPMIIMGFLMFIPGAYHVRIAYCAYKGVPGFSFEDIPEFE